MVFTEAVLIGIVVGLTQAVKMIGMPSKFAALVAIAIGIVIAYLAASIAPEIVAFGEIILTGLIYGLTAAGLYSGTKALVTK